MFYNENIKLDICLGTFRPSNCGVKFVTFHFHPEVALLIKYAKQTVRPELLLENPMARHSEILTHKDNGVGGVVHLGRKNRRIRPETVRTSHSTLERTDRPYISI